MNKTLVAAVSAAAILAGAFSTSAMAAREGGDWLFRVGMTNVDPTQDNGKLNADSGFEGTQINIDDDTSLSLTGVYMFTDSLGIELLASLPFEHDIYVGGVNAGSTQHLPPTLNLQWYFNSQGVFQPYIGAGVNYTTFFSTEWNDTTAQGGLDYTGLGLKLDDSFGYDLQAGVDLEISERLLLNLDVRYISIESDLKSDGEKWATVKINPITVGVNLGWKF